MKNIALLPKRLSEVGGECNFGVCHKLSDDLAQINQNFDGTDNLDKH